MLACRCGSSITWFLPPWPAPACSEVALSHTGVDVQFACVRAAPQPAWVHKLTQPRIPLQGRGSSAADRKGCSCPFELEPGSPPVRCVRPKDGHPGREEPAQEPYSVALVGLLAPSMLLCLGRLQMRCGLHLRSSKPASWSRTRTTFGGVGARLRWMGC